MNNLKLVYVKPIGKDSNDIYEYEFFFSETPDIVWAEKWNVQCPSACGDLTPDDTTYSKILHLKTDILLTCAQENSCFSMQDVIDGILALCWQNINQLDEYPELRPVIHFGETYDSITDLLHRLDLEFEENKPGFVESGEIDDDVNSESDDELIDNNDSGDGGYDIWKDDRYPLDLNF